MGEETKGGRLGWVRTEETKGGRQGRVRRPRGSSGVILANLRWLKTVPMGLPCPTTWGLTPETRF